MVNPDELTPRDLLLPAHYHEYENLRSDFWHRLIRLSASIDAIEALSQYPLGLFTRSGGVIFWQLLADNFRDSAIIQLRSLIDENRKTGLNLRNFASDILGWVKPEFAAWYQDRLRDLKIDAALTAARERLAELRFTVAHPAPRTATAGSEKPSVWATVNDRKIIIALMDVLKRLFEGACLNEPHGLVPLGPVGPEGQSASTEIEEIIIAWAKDSPFIKQPEFHGEYWDVIRQYRPAAENDERNRWREKFGLPPA